MLFRGFAIDAARRVATVVVGLVVLWQVAERAGRGNGEVVVHVDAAEAGVEVAIDGRSCPPDLFPGSPIVRSLRPGTHRLTMTREGRTLCDETFTVEPGGHAVLTAYDETRPKPAPVPNAASFPTFSPSRLRGAPRP